MKIKRYVVEYANDLLRPIKQHKYLEGCPYQRHIEKLLHECERGRMSSTEAIRALAQLDSDYQFRSVQVDIYEEAEE